MPRRPEPIDSLVHRENVSDEGRTILVAEISEDTLLSGAPVEGPDDSSDYGADDFVSAQTEDMAQNWASNRKRLFDQGIAGDYDERTRRAAEFGVDQNRALSHFDIAAHRSQQQFDTGMDLLHTHMAALNQISVEALRTMVENNNRSSQQATGHRDLAIVRELGTPVQQATADTVTSTAADVMNVGSTVDSLANQQDSETVRLTGLVENLTLQVAALVDAIKAKA